MARRKKFENVLILAILISLFIVSNYMLISLVFNPSLKINENWKLLLEKDLVPIDVKVIDKSIVILAINMKNNIVIYNVSLNGKINWEKTWALNNSTLLPLGLAINEHYTYLPVLVNDRHHLLILVIDKNGNIYNKYKLTVSKIIGIYDIRLFNKDIFLLAGTRYKAGYRLQYYLGEYNIETGKLINISVWGTKENDIIEKIIYADNYKIIVLGNSSIEGQKIYVLNTAGDILFKHSIDGNAISITVYKDITYILHSIDNRYYLTSIDLKDLSTKSTYLRSLSQEPIKKLSAILKYGDNLIVIGSIYNTRYGSVFGAIYVLDKNYAILKTIQMGNPDLSTTVIVGTCYNNTLLVSGLFGDKLFISSYYLSSGNISWEQLLPYVVTDIVIAISIIVALYKIKK